MYFRYNNFMYNYRKQTIIIALLSLIFFTACDPAVKGNRYSLKECKQEMLDAQDYLPGEKIDGIVVIKKERKMYLYKGKKVTAVFPVSLGKNPVGHKVKRGDNRTPEGQNFGFIVNSVLLNTTVHLCISYPRPQDKARACCKRGEPWWRHYNSCTAHMECRR